MGRDLSTQLQSWEESSCEEGCSRRDAGFRGARGEFSSGLSVRSWHHIEGEMLRRSLDMWNLGQERGGAGNIYLMVVSADGG